MHACFTKLKLDSFSILVNLKHDCCLLVVQKLREVGCTKQPEAILPYSTIYGSIEESVSHFCHQHYLVTIEYSMLHIHTHIVVEIGQRARLT